MSSSNDPIAIFANKQKDALKSVQSPHRKRAPRVSDGLLVHFPSGENILSNTLHHSGTTGLVSKTAITWDTNSWKHTCAHLGDGVECLIVTDTTPNKNFREQWKRDKKENGNRNSIKSVFTIITSNIRYLDRPIYTDTRRISRRSETCLLYPVTERN